MLQIKQDFDLTPLNTFGLKSVCRFYATLNTKEDIVSLVRDPVFLEAKKMFVLGGGSNVILPEKFEGLVLHPDFQDIQLENLSKDKVRLKSGAGLEWQSLIDFALDNGCFGLENLSLIPGKVGGAPIQNIGAYGVEVGDWIETVEVYDFSSNSFKVLKKNECGFEYRSSVFKLNPKRYLVISVTFVLSKVERPNFSYKAVQDYLKKHELLEHALSAKDLSDIIKRIRSERLPDPALTPNVGSFFKNPVVSKENYLRLEHDYSGESDIPAFPQADGQVKLSAAWLLETCGLKGYQYKHLCLSNQHSLVMENLGQASQKEVLEFSELIKQRIKDSFSIVLEIEPVIKQ